MAITHFTYHQAKSGNIYVDAETDTRSPFWGPDALVFHECNLTGEPQPSGYSLDTARAFDAALLDQRDSGFHL